MSVIFVLIIWSTAYGHISSVEFRDELACKQALMAVLSQRERVTGVCVPKAVR